MALYRKKPVVIEAIQLSWDNWSAICEFMPKPWFKAGIYLDDDTKEDVLPKGETSNTMGLFINTLESNRVTGCLIAVQGDWIIRGIAGEFYPCKPDIFAATYEAVESDDNAK